jgi:hypothetical protein
MSIASGIIYWAWMLAVALACFLPAWADTVSVSCSSPTAIATSGGGTVSVDVNCLINAPNVNNSYRITDSSDNFMAPSAVLLNHGLSFLTALRQSTVNSPDGTVNSISGTSAGFTARLSPIDALHTLRFQYEVTTSRYTPSGHYSANLGLAYYHYRICTNTYCYGEVSTGTAPVSLAVDVGATPVTVSCTSPTVNALPGGGPFTLTVTCTASGGEPDKFSPAQQNVISPGTVTLSNGAATLTATLQPTVISPDSSLTNITGTASGGFTGTVSAWPATMQVQYKGVTIGTTPAGTYTSTPVTFAWSTL